MRPRGVAQTATSASCPIRLCRSLPFSWPIRSCHSPGQSGSFLLLQEKENSLNADARKTRQCPDDRRLPIEARLMSFFLDWREDYNGEVHIAWLLPDKKPNGGAVAFSWVAVLSKRPKCCETCLCWCWYCYALIDDVVLMLVPSSELLYSGLLFRCYYCHAQVVADMSMPSFIVNVMWLFECPCYADAEMSMLCRWILPCHLKYSWGLSGPFEYCRAVKSIFEACCGARILPCRWIIFEACWGIRILPCRWILVFANDFDHLPMPGSFGFVIARWNTW